MKHIVILGDGMADYPLEKLDGKTPLEVAKKPNIDKLCAKGEIGLVTTVPDGLKPGSDVANLSMMGYPPAMYYSGRSPLEALSIGIDLKDGDTATRCNLVTLSDEENYADKTMVDYSSGEISTSEAKELIEYIEKNLGTEKIHFYPGISYRHCMVMSDAQLGTNYTPPHDISDRVVGEYLPSGLYGDIVKEMMIKSYDLLKDHPINKKRIEEGKNPANSIWLWGEGTKPSLDNFEEKYHCKGSVISAVDLIMGIGIGAKMNVIEVEGATGTYHTNFQGKAEKAIEALKNGSDYVYIHMEAPDECGHQGDLEHKILSIELIDKIVVKYIVEQMEKMGEDYTILIAPDHPTPIALKTHVSDPVPYVLFQSNNIQHNKYKSFNEKNAKASGIYYPECQTLIEKFMNSGKEIEVDIPMAEKKTDIDTQELCEQQENVDIAQKAVENECQLPQEVGENIATEPDKQPIKKEKKKSSLTSKQKKIITIIVACIVALAIVVTSIAVPLHFHYKDMVFVSSIEDFNNTDQGKYFVLRKNITVDGDLDMSKYGNYSIDLAGHKLTINGTLTYDDTTLTGVVGMGNHPKKEFVAGGEISANALNINLPNAEVQLMASTYIKGQTNISVSSMVFNDFATSEDVEIEATRCTIIGQFEIENGKATTFKNCENLQIESNAIAIDIYLENSNIMLKNEAVVGNLQLDNNSNAKVYGTIKGGIDGGNNVVMFEGHKCNQYTNIKILAVDMTEKQEYIARNCKVIEIVKLLSPSDIDVQEDEKGRIIAQVVKNEFASKYSFIIDNNEAQLTTDNWLDITSLLKNNGAGTHDIKVQYIGNFDEDNLDATKDILYRSSNSYATTYSYIINLAKPKNISIDKVGNKVQLSFDKVNFATKYKVVVGSATEYFEAKNTARQVIDITSFVAQGGDYSIRVSACGDIEEVKESIQVMTSWRTLIDLEVPANIKSDIIEGQGIQLSWNEVANAKTYNIYYLSKSTGQVVKIANITFAKMVISQDILNDASALQVEAQGYGYFKTSNKVTLELN